MEKNPTTPLPKQGDQEEVNSTVLTRLQYVRSLLEEYAALKAVFPLAAVDPLPDHTDALMAFTQKVYAAFYLTCADDLDRRDPKEKRLDPEYDADTIPGVTGVEQLPSTLDLKAPETWPPAMLLHHLNLNVIVRMSVVDTRVSLDKVMKAKLNDMHDRERTSLFDEMYDHIETRDKVLDQYMTTVLELVNYNEQVFTALVADAPTHEYTEIRDTLLQVLFKAFDGRRQNDAAIVAPYEDQLEARAKMMDGPFQKALQAGKIRLSPDVMDLFEQLYRWGIHNNQSPPQKQNPGDNEEEALRQRLLFPVVGPSEKDDDPVVQEAKRGLQRLDEKNAQSLGRDGADFDTFNELLRKLAIKISQLQVNAAPAIPTAQPN